MRYIAVGLALASTAVSISLSSAAQAHPTSGPCAFVGAIGPNEAGGSYLRCTEDGWITVDRPVCVDFPDFFDCAGDPIRVGPKYTIPGEGTFRPNNDIRPGDYRTSGPSQAGHSCSWVLRHDAGFAASNSSQGPMSVVIAPTDKTFETSGCQPWNPMY
jgi:hypothetical protein